MVSLKPRRPGEMGGVVGQVVRDFVARRVPRGRAGERTARQARIADRLNSLSESQRAFHAAAGSLAASRIVKSRCRSRRKYPMASPA